MHRFCFFIYIFICIFLKFVIFIATRPVFDITAMRMRKLAVCAATVLAPVLTCERSQYYDIRMTPVNSGGSRTRHPPGRVPLQSSLFYLPFRTARLLSQRRSTAVCRAWLRTRHRTSLGVHQCTFMRFRHLCMVYKCAKKTAS